MMWHHGAEKHVQIHPPVIGIVFASILVASAICSLMAKHRLARATEVLAIGEVLEEHADLLTDEERTKLEAKLRANLFAHCCPMRGCK